MILLLLLLLLHIFYNDHDLIQGLYRNEIGHRAILHKGRFEGHTLKGHQLIYQ